MDDLTCNANNTCKTIGAAILDYPNATISKSGSVQGAENMKAEIYKRGPIACGVNCGPIMNYPGGVVNAPNASKDVDHIISIVGWGYDKTLKK